MDRAMADAGRLNAPAAPALPTSRKTAVTAVRAVIVVLILVSWEALAQSGLLYNRVVPSLVLIGEALWRLLTFPDFDWHIDFTVAGWRLAANLKIPSYYQNLAVTAGEVGASLTIGGLSGLAVGFALGGSRLLSKAYEPFLYYLGPTPKIIFFPVMILLFGMGPGSKTAMGTISCFFPIALSTAAGMRQIDGVLIRVGRSFRANAWQMATKIYLPAMRQPVLNGVRLGLGVAIIGTLLAETKISNQGAGFLYYQAYSNNFDTPRMYAMLIVLFVIAIGANALIGRLGRVHRVG
jgi:ABC-type nitrate/sulfonate/bicarbonate transport system permease component